MSTTSLKLQICVLSMLCQNPALAGSIIKDNLPSNTAIVTMDSIVDGTNSRDDVCQDQNGVWQYFQPMNKDLTVALAPGTYSFRIIDRPDAAKLYPSLKPKQIEQIGQAWSYDYKRWRTGCAVFDRKAVEDTNSPQLFMVSPDHRVDGVVGFVPAEPQGGRLWRASAYTTSDRAYAAAKAGGYYNKIYCDGQWQDSHTFQKPTQLIFAIPDNRLCDNNGTVSVLISPVKTSGRLAEQGCPDRIVRMRVSAKPAPSVTSGKPSNYVGINICD